jgi:Excreted virulence factor EspC, type VII ESX diderm
MLAPEPSSNVRVEVRGDELRSHASTVDQLADRAERACEAIRFVRLDAAAYGQICAFVPTLLGPVQANIQDVADAASAALRGSAAALRMAAAAYEGSDAGAAARLNAVDPGRTL